MVLEIIVWILAALLVLGLTLYVIGVYNSVVVLDRSVTQTFGNLESVMKQRHDELPKLVNACRAYMEHERGLLEKITLLRGGFDRAATPEEKVRIENDLNRALGRLNVTLEAYPDLKASSQFQQTQERISSLETILNDRRELFNEAATSHNVLIAQFPALLIAKLFSWREKPLLEIAEEDKTDNLAPFPLQGG